MCCEILNRQIPNPFCCVRLPVASDHSSLRTWLEASPVFLLSDTLSSVYCRFINIESVTHQARHSLLAWKRDACVGHSLFLIALWFLILGIDTIHRLKKLTYNVERCTLMCLVGIAVFIVERCLEMAQIFDKRVVVKEMISKCTFMSAHRSVTHGTAVWNDY